MFKENKVKNPIQITEIYYENLLRAIRRSFPKTFSSKLKGSYVRLSWYAIGESSSQGIRLCLKKIK